MTTQQKSLVMIAFIKSQFGYCTLIWMFHSRSANTRKIKSTREHLETYTMFMYQYLQNFYKKIILSLFIIETSKYLHWKYLKSVTIFAHR